MEQLKALAGFAIFLLTIPWANGFAGGHHLINAGQGLQAAAMAQGDIKRAGSQLLKNAGESLVDIAEGWTSENWEIVTYAADDCAQCFHTLSQIQSRPSLQRIYRTASGELHEVSQTEDGAGLAPNWERLATALQEAAQVESEDPSWAMSLQSAATSILALVREH